MPHVDIKCYAGRTYAQKKMLAAKITRDIAEIFETSEDSVSIASHDIPPENWKAQVWDKEIEPNRGKLCKEPGYDYDD